MTTWDDADPPAPRRLGIADRVRIVLRGAPMGVVVFGGLALLLLVRLIERPVCGLNRPVTPWITQGVCRASLRILGLPIHQRGKPMQHKGAMVANHTSWLDIFVLNARANIYFVSKSEVAGWPGIGWLARATGTVFIRRDRREAAVHARLFEDRLRAGHRLVFFPEGTSTDGFRVLPFKTTLFAAFQSDNLGHEVALQPVTIVYHAPESADPRFYGWWGDMDFGPSLVSILAAPRHGRVELVYGEPVRADAFPNRKSLAHHLEADVRAAHRAGDPG